MRRVIISAIACSLMACGGVGPDGASGGDAHRNEAQPLAMDEWVAGDLNTDEGDRTDWKVIDLDDTGKLTVELSADEKGAEVAVGVFDRYGYSLGTTKRKKGSDQPAKVTVKAKREGRYFIKIQSTGGSATAYSVKATVGEGASDESGEPTPDF